MAVEIDKVNPYLNATIIFGAFTKAEFTEIYNEEMAKAVSKKQKVVMETPDVVIALPSGTKIECTAKSAKYLIIGLGLESVIKNGEIQRPAEE